MLQTTYSDGQDIVVRWRFEYPDGPDRIEENRFEDCAHFWLEPGE